MSMSMSMPMYMFMSMFVCMSLSQVLLSEQQQGTNTAHVCQANQWQQNTSNDPDLYLQCSHVTQ